VNFHKERISINFKTQPQNLKILAYVGNCVLVASLNCKEKHWDLGRILPRSSVGRKPAGIPPRFWLPGILAPAGIYIAPSSIAGISVLLFLKGTAVTKSHFKILNFFE